MNIVRKSSERGQAEHGWLKSFHTFSFGDYYAPQHMGVGPLRVINEDEVQPGRGFATHGHRDMEIISYVLEGELEHRDSIGNGSVIRPGDVQRMSAGSGIRHSEFNPSQQAPVPFLQIWIEPSERGIAPSYEEKHFVADEKRGRLRLVASPDGANGSVLIHQDAALYAGLFDGDENTDVTITPGRQLYVHLARGSVNVDGVRLETGDAVTLRGERAIRIDAGDAAEVLVFDLPLSH